MRDMNKLLKSILKKIIPLSIRIKLKDLKLFFWIHEQICLGFITQKDAFSECAYDTVFLIGVPEHGNLGDQAIGYAEKHYLKKILRNREIFYITEYGFYIKYLRLKQFLEKNPSSEILWHGGGNIGEIYKFHELMRLFAVKHFPDVKITIMPQTIDYNKESNKLYYAQHIYNNHKRLTLFTRERESYDKAMLFFPECQTYLVPDIVLTFHPNIEVIKRQNILICTRNDAEVNLESKKNLKAILDILASNRIKYELTDTVDEERYSCIFENQGKELYRKWEQFASSKVVVTDRLHGMIFSLITNTPCIALDNSTGKVSSFYHTWLEDSKVLLIENRDDLESVLDFIMNSQNEVTDLDDFHFDSTFELLDKIISH